MDGSCLKLEIAVSSLEQEKILRGTEQAVLIEKKYLFLILKFRHL